MQRVWCTKCGKANLADSVLCQDCGERFQPRRLGPPGQPDRLTCPVCGTINLASATSCRSCLAPLSASGQLPAELAGEGGKRGGRITLSPEELAADKPARPVPAPPAGGSRLSRLAEARRQKEAAGDLAASESGQDWLGGLRSDAPPPPDYNTGMDEDDETDATLAAALEGLRDETGDDGADSGSSFAAEPLFPPGPDTATAAVPPSPPSALPSLANDRSNPQLGELGDDTSLPDWLNAAPGSRRPASPAPPNEDWQPAFTERDMPLSTGDEGVPDWLQELSGPAQPGQPPASPNPWLGSSPAGETTSDVPDWLREMNEETPGFSIGTSQTPKSDANEVPDWLRKATDSLPAPSKPSFGDIDVEERLSFAFDEPFRHRPSDDPAGPPTGGLPPGRRTRTGLTDLLGLPPHRPEHDEAPDLPPLPDLSASPELYLGQFQSALASSGEGDSLPDLPDFLLEDGAGAVQSEEPAVPASSLVPWLQGLRPPAMQEENEDAGASGLDNLPQLPTLPPLPEAGLPDFLQQSQAGEPGTPPPSPARPEPDNQAAPWLHGMIPPRLESGPEQAFGVPDIDTPAPLLEDLPMPPTLPVERVRPTEDFKPGTRPFSVRDMFDVSEVPGGAVFDPAVAGPALNQELPPEVQQAALPLDPTLGAALAPGFFEQNATPADFAGEEKVELPDWLRESPVEPDLPVPATLASNPNTAPVPFVVPPLRFPDEEEEDQEVVPFAPPAFEGPEYVPPPDQPSLASLSGGASSDFELPLPDSFSGQPALPAAQPGLPSTPPATPASPGMTDFLSNLGIAPEPPRQEAAPFSFDAAGTPGTAGSSELPDFLREPTGYRGDLGAFLTEEEPARGFAELASPPNFPAGPEAADLPDFLREPTGYRGDLGDFLSESPSGPGGRDASAAGAARAEDHLPDFLGQSESQTTGPDPDSEGPDWATPAPAAPSAPEPGGSLDFLRQESQNLAAQPDGADEEMPPWLQALSSGQAPAPVVPRKPSPGYSPMEMGSSRANQVEIPDWLREEGAEEAPPVLVSGPGAVIRPAQDTSEVLPFDFATATDPSPGAALAEPAATPPEQTEADLIEEVDTSQLPDWLRARQPQTNSAPPDFELGGDLPDWLTENEAAGPALDLEDLALPPAPGERPALPEPARFEDTRAIQEQFGGLNFLSDIEGPAWLRQSGPAKTSPGKTGPLDNAGGAGPDVAAPGQLPNWLRTVAPTTVEEDFYDVPTARASAVAGATTLAPLPQVTLPPRLASAAVLSALLNQTYAPAAAPVEAPSRRRLAVSQAQLVRYGLYLLLVGLALFGLLSPLPVAPLAIAPSVQDFYAQLESIEASSRVLVVYDWEADRSGEMRPLSQAVTRHLMFKRSRLMTLSLNPQGPTLAALVTDELAANPAYGNNNTYQPYGRKYLHLGWRSGNEAAVRGLFNALGELTDYRTGALARSFEAMQGINSLKDFDLVVVLAGDEGSVRTWVEQLGVQPGARVVFGTPASVEPVARPYAQGLPTATQELRTTEKQARARAALAGLNQTNQYEQLLRDRHNLLTDQRVNLAGRLSAQGLAALLLVLVIIGTNIYYLARHARPD